MCVCVSLVKLLDTIIQHLFIYYTQYSEHRMEKSGQIKCRIQVDYIDVFTQVVDTSSPRKHQSKSLPRFNFKSERNDARIQVKHYTRSLGVAASPPHL